MRPPQEQQLSIKTRLLSERERQLEQLLLGNPEAVVLVFLCLVVDSMNWCCLW